MRLTLVPGNSLACKINTHKHGWTGTICTDPRNWNCTAKPDFRSDYCAIGDARCFHLHAFDPADPHVVLERNGAGWLLEQAPDALDDQVLFLYGKRATTERGVPETGPTTNIMFGVYRVRTAEPYALGSVKRWRVRPYEDGWARLQQLNIGIPRYESAGGEYIKQFERYDAARVLSEERGSAALGDPGDVERFRRACRSFAAWSSAAAKRTEALLARFPNDAVALTGQGPAPTVVYSGGSATSRPMRQLGDLRSSLESKARRDESAVGASGASVAAGASSPGPAGAPTAVPGANAPTRGLEPAAAAWIRSVHGSGLAQELEIAFATRDLLVLRGEPGVGKSHLAVRLVDDPKRERTFVAPVSATWRGREDLLGYVNPINGRFEATPFTQFLAKAAEAWQRGDRAHRVVVFEEFNLSQPEHWLADVLAVSQFDDERDRRIALAGPGAAQFADVFLSPAVRFVATVNDDHTTRQLSPRVLDRAAVVRLELTAKEALQRIGLALDEALVSAIADLHFLMRSRGASFSIRSARALKLCLAMEPRPDPKVAVDIVLAQQVLSKVTLSAHEAGDMALLGKFEDWCAEQGADLARCVALASEWREALDGGNDVGLV
jgi:hypothetical protein